MAWAFHLSLISAKESFICVRKIINLKQSEISAPCAFYRRGQSSAPCALLKKSSKAIGLIEVKKKYSKFRAGCQSSGMRMSVNKYRLWLKQIQLSGFT